MNKFEAAKARWRESLVATPEQIATGDENVKNRAKDIGKSAVSTWNTFKKFRAECSPCLFRSEPYEMSRDMTAEYNAIRRMALGYATYGSECYQSPELLSDILFALGIDT